MKKQILMFLMLLAVLGMAIGPAAAVKIVDRGTAQPIDFGMGLCSHYYTTYQYNNNNLLIVETYYNGKGQKVFTTSTKLKKINKNTVKAYDPNAWSMSYKTSLTSARFYWRQYRAMIKFG